MAKQGIKGFSALRMWPVTTNTTAAYAVGTRTDIPSAVSASMDRQTENYSIPADDGIYDSGAEFTGENIEIVVRELALDLMSALDGADYDDDNMVYSWGPDAIAPEIAIGFRALRRDGTYRMVRYWSCRVTSIKIDYQTKGSNNEGSTYTISLAAATRMIDNKLYDVKDTEVLEDLAWLNATVALPGGEG